MQARVLARLRSFSAVFTYTLVILSILIHLECAEAGQYFTSGLSIIDSPSPNSPGHAGSTLPISIDVSGDGKLPDDSFFSLLEIYLVSSETNINLTVVSGTDFLTQESGTVRHGNFVVPTCIKSGNYNLTFYETSQIEGKPFFIITPVPLQIENSNLSGSSCVDNLNTLQDQPQVFSAPEDPPFFAGETTATSTSTSPLVTITVSDGVSFTFPTTITITPTQAATTVVVISESITTIVTTDSQGLVTSTSTERWSTTAVMQPSDLSGFVPVNDGHGTLPFWTLAYIFLCVALIQLW
ncbi:uncharacterized protein BT62DRAFT_1072452 [Guyanagaster necrorhizus]|uniref:Uncharacterized protein n=1 Tax=Guyanagaster necrorhizus TaxID=856835 RepID=A0A9P8AW82_9AGAR|nr:uncharacterized protein BT62DRAFT_1072452 [Guyanagaster necrorhizus MCA 3950]KAG7450364.1 hypothetical protein BT62DRAFT_1072452 [Guyanagaster necrorhizus MCA 3950]